MLYLRSLSMLIGRNISSPSKFVILVAPSDMIFLIRKGLDHLDFNFPLGSKVLSLSTFRTKSPSLRFLGFTFSNPFLVHFCMVLCPSSFLIYQSQLLISFFHPIFLQDLGFHQHSQRLYFYLNGKDRLTSIDQRVRGLPQLMHRQMFHNPIKKMEIFQPSPCMSSPSWPGCS